MSGSANPTDRKRYIAVFILAAAAVIIIAGRYVTLMVGNTRRPATADTVQSVPERGPILDRDGRILSIQSRLDTVYAWREDVIDPQREAELLGDILQVSPESLGTRLAGPTGAVTLVRTISPAQSARIRELSEAGQLPGIHLRQDVGRIYPHQSILGSVIGFVGDDGTGLDGIEYTMEQHLAPAPGRQFGNQVFLTVDLMIQHEAERLARQALEEHRSDWVTLAVMDATNGDLLALASQPSYDPNDFAAYTATERRDRPVVDAYEPGSVFKIFSLASFLQLGGITPADTFVTNGVYDAANPPIHDLANYGTVDTTGIVKYSSNVGAAYASETVRSDRFYQMLKLFGFGEETGLEINGEARGILARPSQWSGRTKPTLAIGQEIAVTTVQLLAAASTFANQGVLIKPHIIDKIVSPSGRVIEEYGRTPVREVISPDVAQTILNAMEVAVQEGTARRLQYDGLRIAAKTGTAEKIDPQTGRYSATEFLASTLAILPADDPKIIVYVAIDNPSAGEHYGGVIAAPIVREFLDFLVPHLNIPIEGSRIVDHPGRLTLEELVLPELTDTVPNYAGLPKRALLPLLQRTDIQVTLVGHGWVVDQTPEPGAPVSDGMRLELVLE